MTHGGGPDDDRPDDKPHDRAVVEFPGTLPPLAPLPSLETSIGPGHTEWVDMEEWESPTSNQLSPFGLVEQFGAVLRSGARRPGWKRTAVKVWAWSVLVAGPVLALLVWLLG